MAYAVGAVPEGTERITNIEMTWEVLHDAHYSMAFYSPWFGMDPADNLNLVQPVNPWTGSSWSMYTEYFQWQPENNSNSADVGVKTGQHLHGQIQYDASNDSYNLSQTIVETGAVSKQVVKCQDGKKFVLPYVVFEKTWSCWVYPPDQKVSFTNISIECDGQDCTNSVVWTPHVKDANCDMKANIDSQNQISITWNNDGKSPYDAYSMEEQVFFNAHGWGAKYASNAAPLKSEFGVSACIDDIVTLGGSVLNLVDDVKSLIGGDITAIEAIIGDVKTIISDVKAALSACKL